MPKPTKSGKDYIANIWGSIEDKKLLLLAAEGRPLSEFLMDMARAKYKDLYGDAPVEAIMPDDQIPERYQAQFEKMRGIEQRNAWRKKAPAS